MRVPVLQIDESWYLRTQIYPQAAPIIARLPLGSCWGYYVTVQVGQAKQLYARAILVIPCTQPGLGRARARGHPLNAWHRLSAYSAFYPSLFWDAQGFCVCFCA